MNLTHTHTIAPLFKLTLLASALLSTTLVYAEETAEGWYTGFTVGEATSNLDNQHIAEKLVGNPFSVYQIDRDKSDRGYKLFTGYQFNPHFSLEGGYFDLGQTDFSARVIPDGSLLAQSKFKGFNLDVMGLMPMTEKLSAFALAGITYAERRDKFFPGGALSNMPLHHDDKKWNPKIGLGLQYQMTQMLALRFEAERYRVNDAANDHGNMNLVSLGLVYRFGEKPAEYHAPSVVQMPVAPPPPPPPVVNTQEYCSILDIEFEIDKDTIQREEKEKLAVLATFLTKYPKTTAVIEGHSDNVGTSESNLNLSQRRAESVVDYLVTTASIAKSRLSAVGYGETRPVDDNKTEMGMRHNRRIKAVISCANDIEGLKPLPARVTMAMLIEFDRNNADIALQYRNELAKVGKFLKENPTVTATVEGHAANTSPETAAQVSQLRAQHVVDYLVEQEGISRARLTAEGFGQSRRFAYNTTAEGRQENRRVNIIINYPKR